MKEIEEIIYSHEKMSLTIIYADGTQKGYQGPIAIKKAKELITL